MRLVLYFIVFALAISVGSVTNVLANPFVKDAKSPQKGALPLPPIPSGGAAMPSGSPTATHVGPDAAVAPQVKYTVKGVVNGSLYLIDEKGRSLVAHEGETLKNGCTVINAQLVCDKKRVGAAKRSKGEKKKKDDRDERISELEAEKSQLEKKLAAVTVSRDESKEIKELKTRLKDADDMVGSLRKELEAAKKAAAVGNATQKDVQNREKELKEKEEQLKEKETEIASLQKKLADATRAAESVKGAMAGREGDLRSKDTQLVAKDAEITSLKQRIASVSTELDAAKKEAAAAIALKKEHDLSRGTIAAKDADIKSRDFTIKAKDAEIAALQKKLMESAGDSQTVASLRKELESIKKEALAVAGTAKKEVSANKSALAAKDSEIKAKDVEIASLKQKLATAAGDAHIVATLRAELDAAKKEAAAAIALKKEHDLSRGTLATKDADIKNRDFTIKAKDAEIAELKNRLQALSNEGDKSYVLAMDVKVRQVELDELRDKHEKALREIETLSKSLVAANEKLRAAEGRIAETRPTRTETASVISEAAIRAFLDADAKVYSTEELGDVKLVYAGDRAYLRAEASRAMGNNPVASVAMEKYNGGKYVYYVMQRNALELRGER